MKNKPIFSSDAEFNTKLEAVLSKRTDHLKVCEETEHLMDFESYKRAHRMSIAKAKNVTDIEHRTRRLAELESGGEAFEIARRTAQGLRNQSGREYQIVLVELFDAAELVLARRKKKHVEEERRFFHKFDLPHETTSVSRRFETLEREVRHRRDGLNHPPSKYNRGVFGGYVEFFTDEAPIEASKDDSLVDIYE